MRYQAEIDVRITDFEGGTYKMDSQVYVDFESPEDPRETLTRVALERAVEEVKSSERWLWA